MLSSRPASPEAASPEAAPLEAAPVSGAFRGASGLDLLLPRLAWGALLLLLLLSPTQLSGFWPADYDFWPQTIFLLLSAGVALLLALSPAARPRFDLTAALIVAFLGWSALASLSGIYRHDSYLELARLLGAWTTFFAIRALWTRARALSLVTAWCAGLMWAAVPAVLDFAQTHNAKQYGPYANNNLFANALALTLPVALIFPLLLWRRTHQGFVVALGTLPGWICLLALAATSSKGGFLAGFAGILTCGLAIWRARRAQVSVLLRRHRGAVLAATLVFLVLFGVLAQKTIGPRLQQARSASDNSSVFRVYIWRSTLDMARERPFAGFGPGDWQHAYPRFERVSFTRHAHQSWLQIAAESGWPALLLLLGAIVCALKSGFRRLHTVDWPLVAGGAGATVAMLVHGSVDSGLLTTSVLILLAAALALLTATEADTENRVATGQATAPRSRLSPFWLGATLLLALAGSQSQKAASGENESQRAEAFAGNGAPSVALPKARLAVALDPGSARLWLKLGRIEAESGGDGTSSFQTAAQLQPTVAANWANLARAAQQHGAAPAEVEKLYDRALECGPLDTQYLLERAQWRLDSKNRRGYDDLEKILGLWSAPYGQYAPVELIVNLDFARATLLLAPELKRRGQTTRLPSLVERALADCARARQVQAASALMRRENADVEALTAALSALQTQLRTSRP